ncbi:hypothetical protein M407DRAFT_22370 [Tulasnella calospora MUT 4182]|uniref:AB hydrolase-1 domain-containing protein n=1 Tax=Tulasnella calospora MUT 4182 TaxID=1051891 RepID=A0A0C3QCL0_9AGAM|nr:hypothetical protein M407DRAFT_22370 [Tulasnella calospora MUT 4182]
MNLIAPSYRSLLSSLSKQRLLSPLAPELYFLRGGRRANSYASFVVREPPANVANQRVIPLIFPSASAWDPASVTGQTSLAAMLAEHGYTGVEIDLEVPGPRPAIPNKLLNIFAKELASQIRLSGQMFKPCIISHGVGSSLIAQTYIESNNASGLVMISPAVDTHEALHLLPAPMKEFTYEPNFPILIVDTPERIELHEQRNRLVKDGLVDMAIVPQLVEKNVFSAVAKWLDDQL